MSHPTFWPKNPSFYPIGNTPPVCLTDHLPPEQDALILLLGCGDPRNILYTVAVDHNPRKLGLTFWGTAVLTHIQKQIVQWISLVVTGNLRS